MANDLKAAAPITVLSGVSPLIYPWRAGVTAKYNDGFYERAVLAA